MSQIRRRGYAIAAAALWSVVLAATAQPVEKIYRIGILDPRPAALNAGNLNEFRQGMQELGHKEGQNFEIAYRSSDGHQERFLALASELVRLKVDLIVTEGTPATLAAKNATRTIPIVMRGAGDPVATGLVASLGHPGGNVTGISNLNVGIYGKRVELLRELVPGLTRVAGLFNMGNPVQPRQWKEVELAARSLGIEPQLLDVRRPEELTQAFDAAAKQRAEALIVALDGVTSTNLRLIAELATKHRLPSMYVYNEYLDVGGLISYGADELHSSRRAATFVDKILKGAKPEDLPVEQAREFELGINLRAAKALGISVPKSVMLRAGRVID